VLFHRPPVLVREAYVFVEDAACAVGSEVLWQGQWERIGKPHGRIACFSFHPRKVVTTGDGAMAILARDSLRSTYQEVGASELYEPTSGRLLGATPLSYAAGLPAVLANERVSVHVLSGAFGVEAGLAADFGERAGLFVIGGSDDVQAQALFYAVAQHPLIGEEVFASGAYLEVGTMHTASLRAQDFVRFGLIVLILLGVIVRTLEGPL